MAEEPIQVRNPLATRPWQHVLEPLGGYLLLGEKLLSLDGGEELERYCDAFNFGPLIGSNRNVESLVNEVLRVWGSGTWTSEARQAVHEASLLNLTIDRAFQMLGWHPVWDFEETIRKTVEWYRVCHRDVDGVADLTLQQIGDYSQAFKKYL
jgi:CDP-glucose 4,6-dehydratase